MDKKMDTVMEEQVVKETKTEFQLKRDWIHFALLGGIMFLGTLVFLGSQLVPTMIFGILCKIFGWNYGSNPNVLLVLEMTPTYVVGMPLFMLGLSFLPKGEMKNRKMKIYQYIALFPFTMCMTMVFNLIGTIFTSIVGLIKGGVVENALAQTLENISLVWILVFVVICAPIFEELVFRKFLVSRTARYGEVIPVLLSGFCFGLFHGNVNQFAYAFALGCFFAYIYVRTGKILYSIGLHMFVNFVGSFLSMAAVKCGLLEFSDIATSGNVDMLMDYVSGHILQMLVILTYMVTLYTLVGVGVLVGLVMLVMLIMRLVKHGEPLFDKGEIRIPFGYNVLTVMINPGMILFILFWLVMMVIQLFM